MDKIKELEDLLRNDVLVEVNGTINELSNKKGKDAKEELAYMNDVKKYFDEVLIDIENNILTQEDAIDILEGLEDMKVENQEL